MFVGQQAVHDLGDVGVIIATAATVVSLSMPLSGHGITVTQRVALACMHLAVAAMLIPVLAATIRRSIPRPGPALRASPQVTPPSQPHRAPADPTRHPTAGGSDHIQHRPARSRTQSRQK
jgi:hypothetical protein